MIVIEIRYDALNFPNQMNANGIRENADTFVTRLGEKPQQPQSYSPTFTTAPLPRLIPSKSQPVGDPDGFSIADFKPTDPQPITETASLRAMATCGILYEDLIPPTEAEVQATDPDVRDLFTDYHQARISRLIERITRVRDSPETKPERPATTLDVLARSEQEKLERFEAYHRREVEAFVQGAILAEQRRAAEERQQEKMERIHNATIRLRSEKAAQAAERHNETLERQAAAAAELERQRQEKRDEAFRREQERLRTLQRQAEDKRDRAKQLEATRLMRAGRNRGAMQRAEDERLARLTEKERLDQERMIRLLTQQREENERKYNENRAEGERKQKILADMRAHEEELAEKRRMDSDNKEAQREERHRQCQAEQDERRSELRAKNDEKTNHYQEEKERTEQAHQQKRMQATTNNQALEARLAELERDRERERKRRAFVLAMRKDERDRNALYVSRQMQARGEEVLDREAMAEERVMAIRSQRQQLMWHKEQRIREIAATKDRLNAGFKYQITHNRASVDAIKAIAQRHGVNAQGLDQRAQKSAPSSRAGNRQSD
jgi:hypothetical protein